MNNDNSSSASNGRSSSHPLDQYSVQPKGDGGGGEQSPFYKSAAPSISLPKGGGALKGIDEKFSVNAVNGTANLDIPLPITPGRGGFTPALSLSYSSGGGNSIFGLGWNLSLPSIQRRTDKKLPLYQDATESDVFLLAGAEDLVPELDSSNNPVVVTSGAYTIKRYIPRIEGLFARIEYINKAGVSGGWWRVTTKDNITTYYGLDSDGRIADPNKLSRIFKWLPQITIDHKGNVQYFTYLQEDDWAIGNAVYEKNRKNGTAPYTNTYLKSVLYCNETPYFIDTVNIYEPGLPSGVNFLMEAVLDYGDHSEFSPTGDQYWLSRSDPFSDFHAGFEIRTYRRCKRVMMFHYFSELNGYNLVRTLELQYQNDLVTPALPLTEADYIVSATQKGYEYKNGSWHSKTLPGMSFTYRPLQWNNKVQMVNREGFTHAPQGLTGPYQWIDFEGEGISGILTETTKNWYYKSNLGDGHFANARSIARKPSFDGLSDGSLQWADLDADGRRQVVTSQPVKGYFELNDDQQWESFRSFPNNANIDWNSQFTKMLDLNGDGRPDAIITEDQAWIWYENEGKEGWEQGGYAPVFLDEEKGPVLVLRDPVQCIFLADMNGDGMTDLVRIKNGEVCYWPNMGYGKFGAKVTMAGAPTFAPQDLYDPKFLTLADISGTGAADLIYIGSGDCKAWINLSGNGWDEGQVISPLPGTDQFSKIAVLDFLGNGTGCIVWSSPLPQHANAPLRYIDLMGGNKPYLMNSYNNGMGKTVSVTYKTSTQFYLADKLVGIPWATKLPFPVHCISSITTHDEVSDTSYTQTYKYRHGYYDHEEREFRGFGYVETVDTDSALFFEQHDKNETQKTLDQYPVLTKTWFHTGAWMRETTLLEQFEKEYYSVNDWGTTPSVATFLWGQDQPTAQEQREAHRALKGNTLRQEVYALDNTNQQDIPYTVAQSCYAVRRQQDVSTNRYGSFLTWQQQALSWSIERKAPDINQSHDARLQHSITLTVDDYGNVLESVQIAYPRKAAVTLNTVIDTEQAKNHIVYNTVLYTNKVEDDNAYRLPLPFEQCSFELYVPQTVFPTRIVTSDDFTSAQHGWLQQASGWAQYVAVLSGNTVQKRLLSCVRTIYKKDDTSAFLPKGWMESLALPYQVYTLAFTQDIFNFCYDGGALIASPWPTFGMFNEAGYKANQDIDPFFGAIRGGDNLSLSDDEARWLVSGTTGYSVVTPATSFYQPDTFTDPKGNSSTVTFWPGYALLPQSTTDAIGNTAMVLSYDWRCLQPTAIQDPNLNISEIYYDTLCMPVATAVKGKGTEADYLLDLSGNNLDPDGTDDIAAQQNFWQAPDPAYPQYGPEANAAQLLGRATWRCIYQLDYHTGEPTAVAMMGREDHYTQNSNSEVVIRITYTDGLGRIAMHKARVADGPLPVLEDNWQLSPPDSPPTEPDIDASQTNVARWVGSGKTVYNNKGKAVMQYEPYFSATPAYDPAQQAALRGVSPCMYYDPLGRMYHTDMPDGTLSYTTWDNWQQTVYDANDAVYNSEWENVRQTGSILGPEEIDAAAKTQAHRDTPTVMHLDALARPFYTMATADSSFDIQSHVELDIQGNRLSVTDALGRKQLTYLYNMLKTPCWQMSIDSGNAETLINFAGQPCYALDAAKQLSHITYDALQRPLIHELQQPDGNGGWQTAVLLSSVTYGESVTPASGTIEDHNLRGRMASTLDGSGMQWVDSYDFKGLPVQSNQRLLADKTKHDANWNMLSTASDLDMETFTTTAVIDALGRIITATDPGGNITRHSYDKGGALNGIYTTLAGSTSETTYVQDIHYDAKGQRQSIWYGNGVKTRYTYDPLNYRLRRLLTVNLNPSPHVILQDLNYYYDPVGNISTIRNDALDTEYFNNNAIRPVFEYTYDALYRLIAASGREQSGASSYDAFDNYQDYANLIKPLDTKSPQSYTQYYTYDAVGNITRLRHMGYNSYTRDFSYDSATNNRLLSTSVNIGPSAYNYNYDMRGNMTAMPHLQQMDWDYSNQLCYITDGSTPTYYQYSGGQRVRKYTDKGSVTEERIYLGNFEIYRKFDGSSSLTLERTTVHVSDDTGRIAMIETRTYLDPTETDDSAQQLQRYIYGDHLGSSTLELDDQGRTISYEEYHPYGTTAWQESNADINAVAKRYRYTGKERDGESGLYYHGARYYAPWLCRWTAADPKESERAGLSPYDYCSNNPINRHDPDGMQDEQKNGQVTGVKPLTGSHWEFNGLGFTKINDLPEVVATAHHASHPAKQHPTEHHLAKQHPAKQHPLKQHPEKRHIDSHWVDKPKPITFRDVFLLLGLSQDGVHQNVASTVAEARVRAFLRMLRVGEGTVGEQGYSRMYGRHNYLQDFGYDMSKHPNHKIKEGKYESSATGAYQVMGYTWYGKAMTKYREQYHINDITPLSQDKFALLILKYKHLGKLSEKFIAKHGEKYRAAHGDVLQLIIDGNFNKAMLIAGLEWASLAGSPYGQPSKSFAEDKALYEKYYSEELKGKSDLYLPNGFLKEFGY